ncbi:unnamed protein product [Strongylus vulgaris]|uniref:Uncharacterized protein n=1 Tax=Strongylus vulgaris TaxID=40348 RepID=A0A3P7J745_STRVU|nr:unnamed protein product [Strongylus vulgaris]
MDRRPSDFPLLRSSPHPDFEPSAPSPESVAASPMLISSRTSECGDPPIESDEVSESLVGACKNIAKKAWIVLDLFNYGLFAHMFATAVGYGISDSGETSRRSTISRMDMVELSRDLEVKNKYPELYQMIIAQRRFGSTESRDAAVVVHNTSRDGSKEDDSKQLLYAEAVELLKRCRRQERQLREMQKNYDNLLSVNKQIKETYVKIYAKAEQEEEYISNILLKRIQKLKNDKETLAQKYEQEEEFLTNDLMRKIKQVGFLLTNHFCIFKHLDMLNGNLDCSLCCSDLQSERDILEGNVKSEQASVIDSLLTTIRRMESEMAAGRKNMDRMRKEKIDQENALEHEQELLFNTLGKQMDQLNQEKR